MRAKADGPQPGSENRLLSDGNGSAAMGRAWDFVAIYGEVTNGSCRQQRTLDERPHWVNPIDHRKPAVVLDRLLDVARKPHRDILFAARLK